MCICFESDSDSCSVMSNFLQPQGIVHEILQARILEKVAVPFSRGSSQPRTPHCRQILYQLSRQGSPRMLEWVAYPFSSGSSQPRNQTGVFCIAGRFFTSWATRVYVLLSSHFQNHALKWTRFKSSQLLNERTSARAFKCYCLEF